MRNPTAAVTKLPQFLVKSKDLRANKPVPFALNPEGPALEAMADLLELLKLRKLRFEGALSPEGTRDWRLDAQLGASVTQECVATLKPVSIRIDEPVIRIYRAEMPEPQGAEVEMPEDDTEEPLPPEIDLAAVMIEALSLALPPYPRSDDADFVAVTTQSDAERIEEDDRRKPFAGLAALRAQLSEKNNPEDEDQT